MTEFLIALIIISINIVISLLIRRLDRNSISLEKMRKYSEKVKAEFDEFVNNRTGVLQDITTELEVSKQDGRILISRLNSLASDFNSKAQGLESRMQAIKELEGHIMHSESEMQKLMNIAELAEKNIEQIRREVDFVDGLAKKINVARSELEALNTAIPEMQKHFNQIAHEELENYKDNILSNVETSIRSIEARLSSSEADVNAILQEASTRLDSLYAEAFENARNKSKTLEDEAFASLQALAEKRIADSRAEFNTNLGTMQEEMKMKLEAVIDEANTFKKEYITKINDYSTTVTNELSNTEIALNENMTQIKMESDAFNNEMKLLVNKNSQGIKDDISNLSATISKEVEEIKLRAKEDVSETQATLDQFKNEWKGELASYRTHLNADFANLELSLKNRVEELKSAEKQSNFELKEYVDSNNKGLRDEVAQVSEIVHRNIAEDKALIEEFRTNWEKETTLFIERIKRDFEETENGINSKSSLLIQKMNEAEHALQATAAYLENEFKNGEKNSTEQMKEMLVKLHRDVDKIGEEADSQIAEFKEQLETRYKKFEALIAGTDQLQSELEKAMTTTTDRMKEEFNQHIALLKIEQQTFAKNFDSQTEKLNLRLNDIDSNVELLKSKAVENVSGRLDSFEREFFSSLSKKNDEINNNFESIKADVKEKLQLMFSEKEAERREVEDLYKLKLKERIAQLEADYEDQFSFLDQKVQDIESNLSKRVASADDSVIKYTMELKEEINVSLEKARQYLDKELAEYKVGLKDSLNTHYFELEEAAKALRDKIDTTKGEAGAEFEAIKNDFENWKGNIELRLNSSKSMFEDKINRIESVTSSAMEGLKSKYDNQYGELVEKNANLFEGLKGKVAELDDQILVAQAKFKKEADDMVGLVREHVDEAFSSIEKKVFDANKETEDSVENVRSLIHTLRENLNEIQEKTTLKIQGDAERLNSIIEEIDKKQNAFIAQTQVFEKADQLKVDLEKSIEKLKAEVSHFEVYRTAMDEIASQYNRVCKIEGEIEEKIALIMNERSRIEKIEGQFARLDEVSNNIDRKIEILKNTGDDIQSYEVQVRRVEESIDKVNARYERLEKKEVVLDQTAESIGSAFEELKMLENEIRSFKNEVSGMPNDIEQIRTSIDTLMFNRDKADAVFSRISSLDELLVSMDDKMKKLQDSRSWLAAVETRLNDLSTKTDEKLRLVAALYRNETASSKTGGAPPLSARENVLKLHREGWTDDEIADAIRISKGEVQLIIEFEDKMML